VRVFWLGCLLACAAAAPAQLTREVEKRVTDFTLPNGLRFIILERHQSPLVSFFTYVGGGSLDDPAGQTGLANLVGRLNLKGAESIGTRNWPEERKALDALDDARGRLEAERNRGARINQDAVDRLRTQWRLAEDAALRYSDAGAFGKLLSANGATLGRSGADWNGIRFSYTLPSNRIEFWFASESQRLMHPVAKPRRSWTGTSCPRTSSAPWPGTWIRPKRENWRRNTSGPCRPGPCLRSRTPKSRRRRGPTSWSWSRPAP